MKPPLALEDRDTDGAKLFSPSAARNREVIGAQLAKLLPKDARVLEVASGTGEHALHMVTLRPDLLWQPSDPDPASRASEDAWAKESNGRMLPSLPLDTTDLPDDLGPFDAVFCANMIHIAPWSAAEGLATLAGRALAPSGQAILYGPFLKGDATAESNLDFDRSLRARDPRWGVRDFLDVKGLFALRGLAFTQAIAMPANNDLIVFRRA